MNAVHPIEERKQAFYKRVKLATGLSDEEIKLFLSERYDSYDPKLEKEYMDGLYQWGKLQSHVKKMAKKPDAPTCPICGAITAPDKDWGWICSKGGLRHRIVHTVSHMSGLQPQTIIAKLEEYDADKEKLRSDTRAAEERSEVRFNIECERQAFYQGSDTTERGDIAEEDLS